MNRRMMDRIERQKFPRSGTAGRAQRKSTVGSSVSANESDSEFLRLQRTVGNRAVVAMVAKAHADRLQVGSVDDPQEAAADRVAAGAVAAIEKSSGPLSARRRAASTVDARPVVGPEGGPVDGDVESAISSARGGGRSLATPVRRQMEGVLGADLGGVRLHSDATSAKLNRHLGAEAFTVGRDIFFSGGLPDTSTRAGVGLLAHELTHTVQQPGQASRSTVQRTLKFNNTKWSSVKSAKLSGSGGGGATFLTDGSGPPLVVKAEPGGASEAVLNSALLAEILTDADYGGWTARTPKARLLSKNEVDQILAKINKPSGEKKSGGFLGIGKKTKKIGGFDPPAGATPQEIVLDKTRQDNFKLNLARPGSAIVFAAAQGDSYDATVDASQPLDASQNVDHGHPLVRLIEDANQLTLFGHLAAADMAIGNDDRIAGKWNSDNLLVKWSKGGAKMSLIDNVSDKALLGGGSFGPKDAFTVWAMSQEVQYAAANDIAGLAMYILRNTIEPAIGGALGGKLTNDNRRWLAGVVRDNLAALAQNLEAGLVLGLAAAKRALASPDKFLKGVAPDQKKVALASLKARHLVLSGQEPSAAHAWIKANKSVGASMGVSFAGVDS